MSRLRRVIALVVVSTVGSLIVSGMAGSVTSESAASAGSAASVAVALAIPAPGGLVCC
ncbi:hypothetical protein GCM10010151_04670 [Actinoallomurus spadix]|uniref:Uncharacterized protein n=1 Tax=Actinoallomurus spadix TaxID=79912 RepID=A0ABN0VUT0_9ACTN